MDTSPTSSALEDLLASIDSYTHDELARLLQASPAAHGATPQDWRQSGRVLGFRQRNQWHYPKFQFDGLEPRPMVADLLRILPTGPNGHEAALFFILPNPYLANRPPLSALDIDPQALRRVAHRYANPAECF